MNFDDNVPMSDDKGSGEVCDTDSMIWTAASLQCLVKELEQEEKLSQSDALLFQGKFVAVPVLLTLAVEIALKAWQCWERQAKPDHGHDLLKLFDGLGEDTQAWLSERLPEVPYPLPGIPPLRPGIRETLDLHKKMFEQWRYLYESSQSKTFHTSFLNEVLTVLINAYDEVKRDAEFRKDEEVG